MGQATDKPDSEALMPSAISFPGTIYEIEKSVAYLLGHAKFLHYSYPYVYVCMYLV